MSGEKELELTTGEGLPNPDLSKVEEPSPGELGELEEHMPDTKHEVSIDISDDPVRM